MKLPTMVNVFWLAAAAAALGACAAAPERVSEVEEARAEVETLASDPRAEAASRELSRARDALARADAGVAEGAPVEQIRHDAYLARRHAETGKQVAAEAEAMRQVEDARMEQREVQLAARTAEAEQARRLAEQRREEAEVSRSMAEAALEETERMAAELREMEAEQTDRGMVLTLSDVLFDTDSADLKEGAEATLDRLEDFLRNHPDRRLMIEGHTDSRGPEEYNRDLSDRRAYAVAYELEQRGIERQRLRPVGLGETYPVASNDTTSGMQRNRRVEIVISNPDGSFPPSAEQRAVAMRR